MTIEFIRLLLLSVLLYFPLLARCLTCGMNFLYCAFRFPEGKREKLGVVSFRKNSTARRPGLRMGKSIMYLFSQNCKLKDIIPFLSLRNHRWFEQSSFRQRLQIAKHRGRNETVQSVSPVRRRFFTLTHLHENSRWKICFLWTQWRATREGKLKTRKRNVSQAWIFQRIRARTKKKRRNSSHVHDMWHSRRRTTTNCCPLCPFIAIVRRSSHAIKVVSNTN